MNDSILFNRGNYHCLTAYQKAECIYVVTYYFAHKFLAKGDRTVDQMVQAARSGKQNIAEGSAAAATSTETELKLTNVARASLRELYEDYCDYLQTRGLQRWDKDSPKALRTRKACREHNEASYFTERIKMCSDETLANIVIVMLCQADVLLRRLLESMELRFKKEGGIKERMYRVRTNYRSSRG